MRRAIGIMEADAMDFSLLFTGINSYYRDFGYADLPRTRASVTVPRAVSRDRVNCRFRVRPAAAGDMPAVRGIYDAFNRDRPIAVQRTEAYWRDWIRIDDAAPPPQLVVAEDGAGTIAGYIRTGVFSSAVPYGAGDSEARIIEFGHAEMPVAGAEDVSLELIRSALDGIPQDRSAVLNLEIPVTPAVRSALIRLAGEDAIKITLSTSGMARLLHPDALLRSFTMAWNDRWKNAGSPGGHAVFATPYGTCTLNADGDFLAVDAGSLDARALAQSDLLGLMFGAATPERITQDAGLSRLLASMLPPSEMVFWGADGF